MASLQYLPDELLLEILVLLRIESFYCITQTCRVFRRLRHDKAFSHLHFIPDFPQKRFEKYLCVGSIRRYTVDMGLFKPPHEHRLPWRDEMRPEDILSMYQSQQNMAMMPYDLRNVIQGSSRVEKTIQLLMRDTLCSSCHRFRHLVAFRHRLQKLMSPIRCEACKTYHPRIHFSDFVSENTLLRSQPTCIGRTRRFKMCAHVSLNWEEYQKASWSGNIGCRRCRASFCPKSASIRTQIGILKHPLEAFILDDETLGLLRAHIQQLDSYICPHVRLHNADFTDYVIHNIRRCYGENGKWCFSNAAKMPLLDYGGNPWTCRTCQTVAYICHRDSPPCKRGTVSEMDLIISRPVVQFDLPSDSVWLAQLEPPEGSRITDAHRITWCEDKACGTSEGGRKEALLIRMLEMAMSTPERHRLYGICPMERSRFLNRVFWWFWSAPDSKLPVEIESYWHQTHIARQTVHTPNNSIGKCLSDYGVLRIDESSPVGYAPHDPNSPYGTPEYLKTLLPHVPEYRRKAAAALLAVTLGDFTAVYRYNWPEQVVLQNMDLYEAYITNDGQIYKSEPGTWMRKWTKRGKIVGKIRSLLGGLGTARA
ncbi:uncharacterized protein PG986_006528 [Apiospora aurea]|uniref:F-box domain-containing protein n=1 Tax=Apiospora aurea TaxID=335848 RepID=A0ABR1QKN8_9PEZI